VLESAQVSAEKLYLPVVIDLCSRKIVGWALANHVRTELVSTALQQDLGLRQVAPNFIFHSDRGSQYGSAAYLQLLRKAGGRQSISARANPYRNAWTESFVGTAARIELFAYIELALAYQSTASFKAHTTPLDQPFFGPEIGCTSVAPKLCLGKMSV
jgi:transposase InsO family protein